MISEKQVKHIAKLARMELTDKELEKFQKELSSILDYVDKLKEVDTSGVEPISQVTELENITREDKQDKKEGRKEMAKKIVNQTPQKKDNYFQVPRILE